MSGSEHVYLSDPKAETDFSVCPEVSVSLRCSFEWKCVLHASNQWLLEVEAGGVGVQG